MDKLEELREYVLELIDGEIIDLQIMRAHVKVAKTMDKLEDAIGSIAYIKADVDAVYNELIPGEDFE